MAEAGSTDDRLREFFTAHEPSPKRKAKMTAAEIRANERDIAMRQKFEKWIQGILQEHIVFSLTNHAKYAAVDMAWDSMPINQQILPLIQYAQGRLDLTRASEALKKVPNGDSYLRKDADGEVTGIDLPKFTEININLLRSVITRRLASQVVKYNRLWPFYKYEPRDQSEIGKLRADMVDQRMDIMADQYDYRHFQTQVTRDMFLYGHSVAFPRNYWERDVQYRRANVAVEFDDSGKIKKEAKVVREGLAWFNPHPSRVFYDNAYPMTSLNCDIGCKYVGYWDVCRWGDIADNAAYFNRKAVSFTSGMVDWFSAYWGYFNQYFKTITPPKFSAAEGGENTTAMNDRKNQVGMFTGQAESVSTIFSNLFVEMRPSNWGIGTYPYPVWVHLKVAGDATVVYAKILPSSPAAVYSHNENDSRLINISLAHELMPFQDQLTNLYSQLLEVIKQDLFAVAILNEDVFPDTAEGNKVRDEFKRLLTNKERYASTQMLTVSFSKLAQLGIKPDQAFIFVRSAPDTNITNIFEAISRVISMADRIEIMSPMEQGQRASGAGEAISAHESVAMTSSTDAMYDFISSAIDEGRAAQKRICFESTIACGSDEVELTVSNRYPPSVVKEAGFTPKGIDGGNIGNGGAAEYVTLTGNKRRLEHDFIFTSRDGGNRPAGPQAAQSLVQMLQAIGSLEADIQKAVISHMEVDKILEIFNAIFRAVDAGVDMRLERRPGEPNYLTLPPNQGQELMSAVQQLAQKVEIESRVIGVISQMIAQINPQAGAMIAQASGAQSPQPSQQPQ